MGEQRRIIDSESVRVRIMELAAAEKLSWHLHREVTDHFFGLTGAIEVATRAPEQVWRLAPGEDCRVEAGRAHSVRNLSNEQAATYLLVQGVGRYDFVGIDVEE